MSDFRHLLSDSKGPGPHGALAHTTHVPSIGQWEVAVRLYVGRSSGQAIAESLRQVMRTFMATIDPSGVLGRLEPDVPYYAFIDIAKLLIARGTTVREVAVIEEALARGELQAWRDFVAPLTLRGNAVLPGKNFFADPVGHDWLVRVCIANQRPEHVLECGRAINRLLDELAKSILRPPAAPLVAAHAAAVALQSATITAVAQ